MTVRKTVGSVGTLAQGAVSTAVTVARHPIGSAAMAAGLVKGATEAGIDLVRSTITGSSPEAAPASDSPAPAEPAAPEAESTVVAEPAAPEPAAPERDLPGPDVFAAEVPRPEDLPEPIVIEALDEPGEAFHTEPKAASRESDHGGPAGDREEAEGYLEEIPDPLDEEVPVWTSETPAEESVFDEAAAKTVASEAEVLQKASDLHKE